MAHWAHVAASALALFSGLLVSWDLIISKQRALEINARLRNVLILDTMWKTYVVAGMIALVGIGGILRYLIWKESQGVSNPNVSWVWIFASAFVIGLAIQGFLIEFLRRLGANKIIAVTSSTVLLSVLALIIFTVTVNHSAILAAAAAIGLGFGIMSMEFSIPIAMFFTWSWTTDPNPDKGRNPRVLARIGIYLFIVASIIELVVSLT